MLLPDQILVDELLLAHFCGPAGGLLLSPGPRRKVSGGGYGVVRVSKPGEVGLLLDGDVSTKEQAVEHDAALPYRFKRLD
jgi:hypothetical protein